MTGPRFHIGQHVAVCTSNLSVVIPATTITEVHAVPKGVIMKRPDGTLFADDGSINYRVAGYDWLILERCLRPINPDTEYLSEPESLEQPA